MKLIIDIDECFYRNIREVPPSSMFSHCPDENLHRIIYKGTPLPKGHGRLIDADKLIEEDRVCDMWTDCGYEPMVTVKAITNAPTIIEAEKEEE